MSWIGRIAAPVAVLVLAAPVQPAHAEDPETTSGPPSLPPVEVQRASPDWEDHWKAGKQAYWGRKYLADVDRRQREQESRRDEAGTGKDNYGETGKNND